MWLSQHDTLCSATEIQVSPVSTAQMIFLWLLLLKQSILHSTFSIFAYLRPRKVSLCLYRWPTVLCGVSNGSNLCWEKQIIKTKSSLSSLKLQLIIVLVLSLFSLKLLLFALFFSNHSMVDYLLIYCIKFMISLSSSLLLEGEGP